MVFDGFMGHSRQGSRPKKTSVDLSLTSLACSAPAAHAIASERLRLAASRAGRNGGGGAEEAPAAALRGAWVVDGGGDP